MGMSIEKTIRRAGGCAVSAGLLVRDDNKVVGFVEIPDVVKEKFDKGKVENKFAWTDVSEEQLQAATEKANRMKEGHVNHSNPLKEMTFSIESHKQKARKKVGKDKLGNDKYVTTYTDGFLLRGSDNKYAKFSTNRQELQDIVDGVRDPKSPVQMPLPVK